MTLRIFSFHRKSNICSLLGLTIILSALMMGCNKEPNSFGLNLLPGSDLVDVGIVDTLTLEAYTLHGDSILSGLPNSLTPLGSYVDPVFGKTRADILMEFAPNDNIDDATSLNIPDNAKLDSISLKLFFGYKNYYPHYPKDVFENIPQVTVYKLNKSIPYNDTLYYSNLNPDEMYDSNPISISPMTISKGIEGKDTFMYQIKIDTLFARELMQASDTLTRTEFHTIFPGIYLKCNQVNSGGCMVYTDLLYSTSNLTPSGFWLYYHVDTLHYVKRYTTVSTVDNKISLLENDQTNSELTSVINDTINQDSVVYLQSYGGTSVYIKIPYLNSLREKLGKVAINKAELILPVNWDDATKDEYGRPVQLALREYNNSHVAIILPEDPLNISYFNPSSPESFIGGTYIASQKAYIFNIPNFTHQLFTGFNNFLGFKLYVAMTFDAVTYTGLQYTAFYSNMSTADRIILNSGKNSRPIKLRIYYTNIP